MEREIWKVVEGYKKYSVSNLGNMRYGERLLRKRLNLRYGKHGRFTISMYRPLKGVKTFKIAFLVAQAFIGKRPDGLQINHIDGDRTNDRVSNLEYVTCKENIRHAIRLGLRPNGENMPFAKLKEEDVRHILNTYSGKPCEVNNFGKRYGVNPSTISNILHRRKWKHVDIVNSAVKLRR